MLQIPCSRVEETLTREYSTFNYTGEDGVTVLYKEGAVLVPKSAYELLANTCTTATQTAPEQFF